MEEAVAVEEKACGGRNLTRVESRGEGRTGRGGRVRGEEADSIFDLWELKLDGEGEGRGWGLYKKKRMG